jgi:Fe-S cluster biogenesis protein NfuA
MELVNLTELELITIEGGCKGCKSAGKGVGKAIVAFADDIYDEVSSWFE